MAEDARATAKAMHGKPRQGLANDAPESSPLRSSRVNGPALRTTSHQGKTSLPPCPCRSPRLNLGSTMQADSSPRGGEVAVLPTTEIGGAASQADVSLVEKRMDV
eukprot:CAMPEP_0115707880 /NCGR_PEP_ID=MMETSP0272-20121206/71601_1 /TAXON_ID=71861 /ORGANISM="Scrippsiella trochoidea, Strain CCMP3099" /LENGTH=104 /DNA_ID=CAMNT_0003149307 /DNA_START=200 /DNA_END=515 /DNA_ORIENTATION=-